VPAAVVGLSLFEQILLIGELPPADLSETIYGEGVSRGRAFPGPVPP